MKKINWQWLDFNSFSIQQLYQVMALRQKVFVVEQQSAYLDADGYDLGSWHLCGWSSETEGGLKTESLAGSVRAYLRVVPPGQKFKEPSIGRVVTAFEVRGTGLGKELVARGLAQLEQLYGQVPVRISAQLYLKEFYQGFGFTPVSDPYLEDAIPHIQMLMGASF